MSEPLLAERPLLQLDKISVIATNGKPLINDISFHVRQGECLAVIGPNGCGKSTLLRALTSQLPLSQGKVLLNGYSLSQFSRQERAQNIAILAQNDPPDPRLTVGEYVALGRLPHHQCCSAAKNRRIIEQALEDTGLQPLSARPMGDLSGGEQQRAALARAFTQTPQLLLLDEPTNHLDPLTRSTLLQLVRRKGIAVIAVLHDLPLIEPFADSVAVMQNGKLVHWDSPHRALTSDILRPVFGMESYLVSHPVSGEQIRIFQAPHCA